MRQKRNEPKKRGEDRFETLTFTTDDGLESRARIGMIALQTDQTIEHESATLLQGYGVI